MCFDIYWNHCTFAEHLDINRNLLMICVCMCQQHFCISKESKSHLSSSICCFKFFFLLSVFFYIYLKTSRRSSMNFPQKETENSGEAGRWSCQSDPCEQHSFSSEFTVSVVGAEFWPSLQL